MSLSELNGNLTGPGTGIREAEENHLMLFLFLMFICKLSAVNFLLTNQLSQSRKHIIVRSGFDMKLCLNIFEAIWIISEKYILYSQICQQKRNKGYTKIFMATSNLLESSSLLTQFKLLSDEQWNSWKSPHLFWKLCGKTDRWSSDCGEMEGYRSPQLSRTALTPFTSTCHVI